mgnify:CR=1 FL=1
MPKFVHGGHKVVGIALQESMKIYPYKSKLGRPKPFTISHEQKATSIIKEISHLLYCRMIFPQGCSIVGLHNCILVLIVIHCYLSLYMQRFILHTFYFLISSAERS